MRERWSKVLMALTGALAMLLAYTVADLRNPAERAAPSPPVAAPATKPAGVAAEPAAAAPRKASALAGKEIYSREGCARCHSIEPRGRNSLDGVGERLSADEIRKWIVAAPELEGEFSAAVFGLKQAYGNLPEDELEALVTYVQNPKAGSPE